MVVAPSTVYGGTELADLLRRERVTHAFVTPAALASVDPTGLDHIRCVVTGGESCPPALVAQWAPGRVMFNAYGPTEATVVASVAGPLTVGEPVTIGRPSRGCGLLVLDSRLHPVPRGVPRRAVHHRRRCGTWVPQSVDPDGRTVRRRPPTVRRASGCTAPATWRGGTPPVSWNTWAAPTSR